MNHIKQLTIIILLSIVAYLPSQAQVQRGDVNLGANIFISSVTGIDVSNVTGVLVLSYQQFVTDNISLGFAPTYQWTTFDTDFSSTFGAGLLANYSFLTDGGKLLPYAGLKYFASITYSESEPPGVGNTFTYSESRNGSIGINGGLKFFFSERANLDTNLSYTTVIASSVDTGDGLESVDAEGGIIQFTIGIGIILGKRGS